MKYLAEHTLLDSTFNRGVPTKIECVYSTLSLEHEPGTTTTITTQKEFKETADVVLYPDSRGMFSLIPHFGYFHFLTQLMAC